jgi:hypothetical protein
MKSIKTVVSLEGSRQNISFRFYSRQLGEFINDVHEYLLWNIYSQAASIG